MAGVGQRRDWPMAGGRHLPGSGSAEGPGLSSREGEIYARGMERTGKMERKMKENEGEHELMYMRKEVGDTCYFE